MGILRESAATLETESGFQMESPGVSQFRSYILIGKWPEAENCLSSLGVTEEESLRVSSQLSLFLLSKTNYMLSLGCSISYQPAEILRATGSSERQHCTSCVTERVGTFER